MIPFTFYCSIKCRINTCDIMKMQRAWNLTLENKAEIQTPTIKGLAMPPPLNSVVCSNREASAGPQTLTHFKVLLCGKKLIAFS